MSVKNLISAGVHAVAGDDMSARRYSAGVYEQTSGGAGWGLVEWSRHRSEAAARAAARRYLARLRAPTGGAYSWSAWWRHADGPAVEVSRAARERG